MMQSQITRSSSLSGIGTIRMIAAFLIIIFHTHALTHLATPGKIAEMMPYFPQAVPLFFTASGFILSFIYFDRLKTREECIDYYIRRVFRIAPLFYFMLILWLVMMYFNWGVSYTANQIVLNIFFMFNLTPGLQESIVWAGWSIGVEVIFYLWFPMIINFIQDIKSTIFLLCISLLISDLAYNSYTQIGATTYAYMNFYNHLPFFLFGCLAFHVWNYVGLNISKQHSYLNTLYFLLFLLVSYEIAQNYISILPYSKKVFWGIGFVGMILSLCYFNNALINNRLFTYLGSLSYSFYLLHPLIIELLLKFNFYSTIEFYIKSKVVSYFVCQSLTLFIVVFIGCLTNRCIERPGIEMGDLIINKMKHRKREPLQVYSG